MNLLTFGLPYLLSALVILPALWWFLRTTPPKPSKETFPPFVILQKLKNTHETSDKTPWWLLLLRIAMVALIIIALAQPIFRLVAPTLTAGNSLLLIIDNGWASANEWDARIKSAENLIGQTHENPIYLVATANELNQNIGPFNLRDATMHLKQLKPKPLEANRAAIFQRVAEELATKQLELAYFSDGIKQKNDEIAFQALETLNRDRTFFYSSEIEDLVSIVSQENTANALQVKLIRPAGLNAAQISLAAFEKNGLRLGNVTVNFADRKTETTAEIILPLEIRNDITRISVLPTKNAANSFLIGSADDRKKVGLLSPPTSQMTQPLLSPLYYITKALAANSEVITTSGHSFFDSIVRLINQQPAVIIIDDVANVPSDSAKILNSFIEKGGMVIRFAGPLIANAEREDELLPVKLRRGERNLSGIMSWSEPQKIASFPEKSPFFGLEAPELVTVSRQILPEPGPDLFEKSWITLSDGTPLVTAEQRGKGWLVFVHTSPDISWTNLPLSGFLETMMNKLVMQAGLVELGQDNIQKAISKGATVTLAPWRILDGHGQLTTPLGDTKPLILQPGLTPVVDLQTPPGLYGRSDQFSAINLMQEDEKIEHITIPNSLGATLLSYGKRSSIDLTGLLLLLASALFAFDCLLMLMTNKQRKLSLLGDKFSRKIAAKINLIILIAIPLGMIFVNPTPSYAQMDDQQLVDAAAMTHLAYVITNDAEVDSTSKNGLEALSLFTVQRTTIDPGSVYGLNLEKDELSFFPLIYWPITIDSPVPSQKTLDKINTYMKNGGTILFDTRDQLTGGLNFETGASPLTQRLRSILSGLNIPPLEPAPLDHVISRSYYIMPSFPGRYSGSPLWIEAMQKNFQNNNAVRSGDGVSSVLITANDFAAAWATDGKGGWQYNLVPDDPAQRLWAMRGGLNIVMYVLTGNYKADQLHASELLKRLGQEEKNQEELRK